MSKLLREKLGILLLQHLKVDRNNDGVINEEDHKLLQPGDDFGFSETTEFFADSKNFSPTRKIDI